jgi:hypothetical protein
MEVCFSDDEICGEWARNVRATAPDAISFEFLVTSRLWGQPGVTARIVAVMVLPREGKAGASGMPLHEGGLEDDCHH